MGNDLSLNCRLRERILPGQLLLFSVLPPIYFSKNKNKKKTTAVIVTELTMTTTTKSQQKKARMLLTFVSATMSPLL